jgi:hypothetical protein
VKKIPVWLPLYTKLPQQKVAYSSTMYQQTLFQIAVVHAPEVLLLLNLVNRLRIALQGLSMAWQNTRIMKTGHMLQN